MIGLQFVRASGYSSGLIAWWGNGWHGFSHVDAVLPTGRLFGARSDVIGAQPAGVYDRPPFYDKSWVQIEQLWLDADASTTAAWVSELWKERGRPYDKPGIIRFLLGQEPKFDGMWFCSALQVDKLVLLKHLGDPGIPSEGVTPDLLHALVCSAGWTRKVIKNANT